MTKAIERLEELLDQRDEEIERLRDELNSLREEEDECNWAWARHRTNQDAVEGAPVPRLQLLLKADDDYRQEWELSLITADFMQRTVAVPLMASTRSGGSLLVRGQTLPTKEVCDVVEFRGCLPSLMTELVSYSRQIPGIPAVIVMAGGVWQWLDAGKGGAGDQMRRLK